MFEVLFASRNQQGDLLLREQDSTGKCVIIRFWSTGWV